MTTPTPEAAPAPQGRKATTAAVTLVEPIERDSGDICEITLRKPVAGELRGVKLGDLITGEVGAVITVLPRICDPFITEQEAARIGSEDIAEIAGTIAGFFMTAAQKAMAAQMMGQM